MQQQILVERYNLERKTSRDIHLIGLRFTYLLWIKPSSMTFSLYEYIKRKKPANSLMMISNTLKAWELYIRVEDMHFKRFIRIYYKEQEFISLDKC